MDADRWKFGPPEDEAILPWYQGIYSHAFVALHPFFEIEGLAPELCSHGALILYRCDAPEDVDIVQWMDAEAASRAIDKEFTADAVDVAAKRFGKKLSWRTLCHRVGFPDQSALDRALRTHIGGLRAEYQDQASAERLVRYCRDHQIFLPPEGRFPPVLQHDLAGLFRRTGIEELVVADEFGDVERVLPLSTLHSDALWDGSDHLVDYGTRRLFAPDRSLMAWVHWDSFFTLLLGTESRLRDTNLASLFEGFWCSDETRVYWLNQPALPLVQ